MTIVLYFENLTKRTGFFLSQIEFFAKYKDFSIWNFTFITFLDKKKNFLNVYEIVTNSAR